MKKNIFILIFLWFVIVLFSFLWNIKVANENRENLAKEGAQAFFEQVVLSRAWNAGHGGVYVPISNKVQPNPYLKDPKREIITNQGQQFTKINPAFMTRQIAEIAGKESGVQFHITSLNPIRPANKADDWERNSLEKFEQGTPHVGEYITNSNNNKVYRYMAPLITKKACLKCHAVQGYKEGDIRGGISVTLPFAKSHFNWAIMVTHIMAFLIGSIGFLFFGKSIEKKRKKILEANNSLKKSMDQLQETQDQLVESKKMASLGELVAGVAHEVNTPLGSSITVMSNLTDNIKDITVQYKENKMQRNSLENFLKNTFESSNLTLTCLERIKELVQSFKKVSVDQVTEQKREFNLKEYLNDIIKSIEPTIKKDNVKINITCSDSIKIKSYPGVFAQILTNLINNSAIHGFDDETGGKININIKQKDNQLIIQYTDNGKGMSQETVEKIFTPFYTTNKQKGTGLGMNIVYNLIKQKLNGLINLKSEINKGINLTITIPL